jgi:hypothetical protein
MEESRPTQLLAILAIALALVALVFTATMAQARIGWTESECRAKYGRPTKAGDITSLYHMAFYKPEGFERIRLFEAEKFL